jgi:predicted dehydrogenase
LRHAASLHRLGHSVFVQTRQSNIPFESSVQVPDGLTPDYVVVANETSKHDQTLRRIASSYPDALYLIEKPLAVSSDTLQEIDSSRAFVAFHLRFATIVNMARAELSKIGDVKSFQFYVGQHLSTWRQYRNARQQYSAHRHLGGGALRDLSHEVDLALLFLGDLEIICGLMRRIGNVTVDSEDQVLLLLESEGGAIGTVNLNYLDHHACREFRIVGSRGTLSANLLEGSLEVAGSRYLLPQDRQEMTDKMHSAVLSGQVMQPCTISEGARVDRFIQEAEAKAGITP